MAAPALSEPHDAPDSLATVGAWKRLVAAGFTRSVRDDWLIAAPADRLTDAQRTYLKLHQITLVEPLHDTETLRNALSDAGAAGLDWREGKPPDCADERRLAAGEVQYGDGRRVNRNARRYACQGAPCAEAPPGAHPNGTGCPARYGGCRGTQPRYRPLGRAGERTESGRPGAREPGSAGTDGGAALNAWGELANAQDAARGLHRDPEALRACGSGATMDGWQRERVAAVVHRRLIVQAGCAAARETPS